MAHGEFVVSREVAAAQEHVWNLLTCWDRQGEWMPLTTVRAESADGDVVRLRAETGLGPIRVVDLMVVSVWQPPHRCVVIHEGRVLKGTATFTVVPLGAARCRLTWSEHLTGLGRLVVAARPFFTLALRRFAKLAEQR